LPVESVECPSHLPEGAAEIWWQYQAILVNRGIMHNSFVHALTMLTMLTYEWLAVSAYLHRGDATDFLDRITQSGPKGGVTVSAEFVIRAKLQDQIVKLLGQFGLTPATLSSIAGAVTPPDDSDKDEEDDGTAEAGFLRVVG